MFPTDGTWAAGTIHKIGLGITADNIATLYVDGVAVKTATYTTTLDGGAGAFSSGNFGSSYTTLDNLIIRSAR